jgi:hypothetical protein
LPFFFLFFRFSFRSRLVLEDFFARFLALGLESLELRDRRRARFFPRFLPALLLEEEEEEEEEDAEAEEEECARFRGAGMKTTSSATSDSLGAGADAFSLV